MKKPCEICGGSGQISYFKGVSRFLLSWEECPGCDGLGYRFSSDDGIESGKKKGDHRIQLKKNKLKVRI